MLSQSDQEKLENTFPVTKPKCSMNSIDLSSCSQIIQLPGQRQLFQPLQYDPCTQYRQTKYSLFITAFIDDWFCRDNSTADQPVWFPFWAVSSRLSRFEHISLEVYLHSPSHEKRQREPIRSSKLDGRAIAVTSSLCNLSVGVASTVAMKPYHTL